MIRRGRGRGPRLQHGVVERFQGGMLGAESFEGDPMRKCRRRKWKTILVEFVFPVAVLGAAILAAHAVVAEAVTTVTVVASFICIDCGKKQIGEGIDGCFTDHHTKNQNSDDCYEELN